MKKQIQRRIIIIVIIIIIIIIINPIITFMQAIYNYIPETNRVSEVYSVAGILYLQSVLHVGLMLFYGIQRCSCSVFTICATCNVICTVYSVAAVLCLQSVLHVMLFVRYTVLQLFCVYNLCYM